MQGDWSEWWLLVVWWWNRHSGMQMPGLDPDGAWTFHPNSPRHQPLHLTQFRHGIITPYPVYDHTRDTS